MLLHILNSYKMNVKSCIIWRKTTIHTSIFLNALFDMALKITRLILDGLLLNFKLNYHF
jgi:hypothetical protein